jgi:chorismate lyase/3-hydroxybenzoate synthase
MRETSAISHNLSVAEFLQQQENLLGAICFSVPDMPGKLAIPCLNVPMRRLDNAERVCEVWHGRGPLAQGRFGDIDYRHDDGLLFGVMVLPEMPLQTDDVRTPLQQATESAYRQIFELLDQEHLPYLFRVWNYIADINTLSFGLERYQQFNRGRQDAFVAHGRDVAGNAPAACALGYLEGPLTIAFLAGIVPPLNLENPRQISACLYPPQYGPRSPTFSRASLVRIGEEKVLFISGTASIVGHATLHPGDAVAQTRETMTNIEAVLSEANRHAALPGFDLAALSYKVYVRHPADLTQIRAELSRCVGDSLKAVFLQADVCRQDLLLEIEATGVLASGPVE